VVPGHSSNRNRSPLVALFIERAGFGPRVTPERAISGLIERAQRPRVPSIDQQIHYLLRDRKVVGPELVDDLDCDGSLEPLGPTFAEGFKMRLKKSIPLVRARFTLAHEVCHTFFYELVPELKFVPHETNLSEERLCNAGAAAILVPGKSLRRRMNRVPVSLETLEIIAAEYQVSVATLTLRLRALELWDGQLSRWQRLSDGRFVLDTFYGGRRSNWEWQDPDLLHRAWASEGPLWGRMFVHHEDAFGVQRYRQVSYEVRRQASSVIALWGATISGCNEQRLPLLMTTKRQTRSSGEPSERHSASSGSRR
jgi:hypothetical protein